MIKNLASRHFICSPCGLADRVIQPRVQQPGLCGRSETTAVKAQIRVIGRIHNEKVFPSVLHH